MEKRKRTGRLRIPVSDQRIRMAMGVYPGRTRKEVKELLETKAAGYLLMAFPVSLALVFGAVVLFIAKPEEGNWIERPAAGSASVVQKVQIEAEEGWQEIEVLVSAKEYAGEEVEAFHAAAEAYLDQRMPGENTAMEEVGQPLCFPDTVPGGFPADWSTTIVTRLRRQSS